MCVKILQLSSHVMLIVYAGYNIDITVLNFTLQKEGVYISKLNMILVQVNKYQIAWTMVDVT